MLTRILRFANVTSALVATSLLVAAPAAAKVVRLTSEPSAGHPDIAVDADGTAHVVWNERAAGQPGVLVYCRVPRGANGCSRTQRFALPGAQTPSGDDQRAVISRAGEVILVARRDRASGPGPTYVMTSGDGGSTFTAPGEISDLGGGDDWDAQFGPGDFSLSLVEAGCLTGVRYQAAPLDATNERAAALTPFTGGGCGITTPWLGSPSIGFVDPLTPLVAFRVSSTADAHGADTELYFRRWNGAGGYNDAANWTPARLIARGDGSRLASGPRGAYVMYHDPRAQGEALTTGNYWVRRYDPAANTFGSPTRVSRGAVNDVGGDFMQDDGGNLHAVFSSRKEVRHRVSRDGVTWDPMRVLARHTFRGRLRVGAARDGGGAAVARGSGRSANGIYLLTFGPTGHGGGPECPPSVTVGVVVVRALEGCLERDRTRHSTGGAVKVNGVDVEPQRRGTDVYRLTVDTKERTIETRGEANVRVGGVVLDRRAIAWKVPAGEGRLQRLGVPDVSVFPDLARFAKTLFSFPVKGDAELRVAKGAKALIDTSFQMPALLGGVTGDVTLRTTDQQGLVLDGFTIKLPQARIGKLRIAAVEVVYESDPDVFKGSAKIQLPPAYGPPLSVAFGFREGRLNLLHADKRFDPTLPIVGAPPEPVVGLDLLGFDYLDEAGSRTFQGLVELQGGPKVRGLFRVSELDGKVTLTFPPEPQPASIDAIGELKIVGIPFATGHVRYSTDNVFSFDGSFQFPPPGRWDGFAKVSASVAGFLALSKPYPFSAGGDASASIAGVPVSGEAVISTAGVSGCVPLPDPLPDLGVSYRWGDSYPTPSCNIDEFKLQAPGTARAAQAGRAVSIPAGLPQAALAVVGRGGPPKVRVTAPSGEQVTTGPGPRVAGRFITQQLDEAATTYVSIGEPPAGRYTIEPEPGSPPIESVSLARGLPDPSVTAKVTGTGSRRTLRYRTRAIAGQRVTFAEQSAGGLYRELATTRKARGRISFHPENSSQRKRQIVALVEQNGYPRAKLELARFTAPKPRPLARPRRVRITRKRSKLIVRWSKVERARGYELRIDLPRDGRRLLRSTKPGRRTLVIGGLERNDTGTVTVRAIDDDATPGKPRTARLARAIAAVAVARRHVQPHIAVQNTWFTDANVRRYGVRNDVISISGHWFLQEGTHGGDLADFLAKTQSDVERRLDAFKAAHREVDPGTHATIVIDIERPHPKDLHTYEDEQTRRAIVAAYRVRIAATKAAFPNAKLALYGTLNPDGRGRSDDPTYEDRRDALIDAGRRWGLFDDLDYLVPVLYVRFGCDDELNGPCDRYWDTLDEYTRLGIDGSSRLRRSDGSRLPLLPLLGFKVYNGSSRFHRELLIKLGVPDPVRATLRKQIDIFAHDGVKHFAFWTGRDSNQLGGATVTDYLCQLFRPRCR